MTSGGFHIIWLMPPEGLFAFLILSVSLKFGFGLVIFIVLSVELLTNLNIIKKLKSNRKQRLRVQEFVKLNIYLF